MNSVSNLIRDEILISIIQIGGVYITGLVGFLGILFNAINIVVFVKLGFSDTTNISLLGLAVADIGVSLPMLGYSIINNPVISSLLGQSMKDAIIYAVEGSVHVLFCRISGLLTAFLGLERFICVAWPLHVKILVTLKLTVCVVIGIFVVMISCNVPFFVANVIGRRFDLVLNETVYGIVLHPNGEQFEAITTTFQVLAQMTSFVVVTVSTLGLIKSLSKLVEWRKSTSASSFPGHASRKEKQLVKMIILISTVFIACSLPTVAGTMAMVFVKEFNVRGSHRNLFLLVCLVFFILNSINSMVNIFVYVNMSSRYRENLFSLFKFKRT